MSVCNKLFLLAPVLVGAITPRVEKSVARIPSIGGGDVLVRDFFPKKNGLHSAAGKNHRLKVVGSAGKTGTAVVLLDTESRYEFSEPRVGLLEHSRSEAESALDMEQKRLLSAMDQTRTTMTSYLEFDELDCGTTPSNTTYYKDKNYMTRTGTEPEIRAVNRCALACSEMAATDCGGFVFVKNDAGAEIDGNSMYPQFACKFRSEYKNSPEAGAGKCDSNSDLRFYQRTAGFITGS